MYIHDFHERGVLEKLDCNQLTQRCTTLTGTPTLLAEIAMLRLVYFLTRLFCTHNKNIPSSEEILKSQ